MSDVKNQKERALKEVKAFKEVFSSESGKVVLEKLEHVCHFRQSMINESEDISMLPFKEGQRNVYLFIQYMLNYDTSILMDENKKTVEY